MPSDRTIEIARGFFDQTHAFRIQRLELRRRCRVPRETDGIQSSFGHDLFSLVQTHHDSRVTGGFGKSFLAGLYA